MTDISISTTPTRPASWAADLVLVALVSLVWFCVLLGMRPLSNPDEGRYTEIPREMAVTGDFVTPRLDGVKYFEKPPLVYWLSALTIREFGVSEFTARVWNGILAALGALMTYATARALYGRAAGLWSAFVLSTLLLYYALSQIILLDMAVAVTMSGALFAFLLAEREPRGRKRFALFMAFYVMVSLATLSKGLIGIALPGAVMFLWILLLNRWKSLRPFYPILGTVVVLAIAAPWHVLAARANPDFLNFYFYHEHWLRFTTRIHGRFEPWWFFLPIFVAGLFPWVFFSAKTLRFSMPGGWKTRKKHPEAWFFVIWIAFVILFFSKSQSKLIPYILPVFPACAVLYGRYFAELWSGREMARPRLATGGFAVLCLLLAIAAFVVPAPKNQPEMAAALPVLRVTLGGALVLGAALAFVGLRRDRPRFMLAAVAASGVVFLLAISFGAGSLDKASTKKFAMILKPVLKPGDRVFCIGFYGQDLPVYLGRTVDVVDYRGELSYGIDTEPELTSDRFFPRNELPAHWEKPGNIYALVRNSAFEKWFLAENLPHEIMARSNRFTLVKRIQP